MFLRGLFAFCALILIFKAQAAEPDILWKKEAVGDSFHTQSVSLEASTGDILEVQEIQQANLAVAFLSKDKLPRAISRFLGESKCLQIGKLTLIPSSSCFGGSVSRSGYDYCVRELVKTVLLDLVTPELVPGGGVRKESPLDAIVYCAPAHIRKRFDIVMEEGWNVVPHVDADSQRWYIVTKSAASKIGK